jgi:hypothetical protein
MLTGEQHSKSRVSGQISKKLLWLYKDDRLITEVCSLEVTTLKIVDLYMFTYLLQVMFGEFRDRIVY